MEDPEVKLQRYRNALALFVDRLKQDRWALGAVLQGSLSDETIWRREKIHLWIIEADGVTLRRKFDDENKRIFRTFVEEGIVIEAELIPRLRFKQMIEGTSRTAFTCNFFAKRVLLYASDASLQKWFQDASLLATKDQQTALWIAATWLIHPLKYIERLLDFKKDFQRAREEMLWVAWTLAAIEVIQRGEIREDEIIRRGMECNPELFQTVYTDVQSNAPDEAALRAALNRVRVHLDEHGTTWLNSLIQALKKKRQLTSLSELADDYAHTQIYPWHIETACEWLAEKKILNTLSSPIRLTKRSAVELEEPAYEIRG